MLSTIFICHTFFNTYRINIAFVSVIEVGVQMFLGVKGLAAKAAGPLWWPVLMFRLLLWPKDISTLVERAFQWQFYLILLQYWYPSLKFQRGFKNYLILISLWFYNSINYQKNCYQIFEKYRKFIFCFSNKNIISVHTVIKLFDFWRYFGA